jgi:hypothetical protein
MNKRSILIMTGIWIGWFLILYGFQRLATARFDIQRPDTAVIWSQNLTRSNSEHRSVYLQEPFLNDQVAWDSEYYIGIAVGGYDDPLAGRETNPNTDVSTARNYSFFPLYPYLMRALAAPLRIFSLNPIATAALAGVILSLLGTLAGMIALYDLTSEYFDEESRLRTVFYLLIFPSAFFLAQVYTEGLFIGLAFGSLALTKRRQWIWASLLAALAAWTRAYGAVLALPLAYAWWASPERKILLKDISWKWILQGVFALLPVGAFALWRYSALGQGWAELQSYYFGRGFLSIGNSVLTWIGGFWYATTNAPAGVYLGIEVIVLLATLAASLALLRRDPIVALYSLAVVILSIFSGSAQSMERYMLAAPAVFIVLSRLGRNPAFDRFWTIASLLVMGMSAMLFSFNFWVG